MAPTAITFDMPGNLGPLLAEKVPLAGDEVRPEIEKQQEKIQKFIDSCILVNHHLILYFFKVSENKNILIINKLYH